jgi:hypothetical protein
MISNTVALTKKYQCKVTHPTYGRCILLDNLAAHHTFRGAWQHVSEAHWWVDGPQTEQSTTGAKPDAVSIRALEGPNHLVGYFSTLTPNSSLVSSLSAFRWLVAEIKDGKYDHLLTDETDTKSS